MILFALTDEIKAFVIHTAPDMPPDAWVVTACILGALLVTAIIDIFTTRVPNILVYLGLITTFCIQGILASWNIAIYHLFQAVLAGALIWVVNAIWYRIFRHDALGMGDAKWTMLAVACFGVRPSLFAWGVGSILAVIFISAAQISNHKIARVTFAPFLFIGLCVGIYWLRFKA